jgi:hypothetical protein
VSTPLLSASSWSLLRCDLVCFVFLFLLLCCTNSIHYTHHCPRQTSSIRGQTSYICQTSSFRRPSFCSFFLVLSCFSSFFHALLVLFLVLVIVVLLVMYEKDRVMCFHRCFPSRAVVPTVFPLVLVPRRHVRTSALAACEGEHTHLCLSSVVSVRLVHSRRCFPQARDLGFNHIHESLFSGKPEKHDKRLDGMQGAELYLGSAIFKNKGRN